MYVVSSWLCVVEIGKITKELITGVFIHERAGYQRIFVIQKLNSEEHMIDNKTTTILEKSYYTSKDDREKAINSIFNTVLDKNISVKITEDELYLVIDEIVSNAMENGNKWDKPKKIHVKIAMDKKYLNISVVDEGNGFNISKVNLLLKNKNVLRARGRGIFLLNKLCKPKWNDKGNEVDLQIELK